MMRETDEKDIFGHKDMFEYIDMHAHPQMYENPDIYIQSRQECAWIVSAGTHPGDWDAVLGLAVRHPKIRSSLGIHPWALKSMSDEEVSAGLYKLENILMREAVDAISECGIDGSREDIGRQTEVFLSHYSLALKYHKPLIIHCHKAYHILQQIFRRTLSIPIVLHGFSGNASIQRWAYSRGLYISLGRSVLRSSPMQIDASLKDRIVFETDDDGRHTTPLAEIAARSGIDACRAASASRRVLSMA